MQSSCVTSNNDFKTNNLTHTRDAEATKIEASDWVCRIKKRLAEKMKPFSIVIYKCVIEMIELSLTAIIPTCIKFIAAIANKHVLFKNKMFSR